MEFLDGRIFEDASFPGVIAEERNQMWDGAHLWKQLELISQRWHDAIRTLAKLHRVDPPSVGLSNFGRSSGFYYRQIKTLSTIAASQAQAVDLETNVPVGKIPHFDEMVAFFKYPVTQPKDRTSLIHGDYKIDNLIFHKTKPRVIGILEYVYFFGPSNPRNCSTTVTEAIVY